MNMFESRFPSETWIDARLKKAHAEIILRELGLSSTEAVTLFYRQITLSNGLPFEVKIPNEVTLKTIQETDAGKNIIPSESTQDLFDQLSI